MKKIIPLLALLLIGQAWGAIAIVQTAVSANTNAGATKSATFASAVTSGNAIIWVSFCGGSTSAAFTSITDDKSDTYPTPDQDFLRYDTVLMVGHLTNITSGPTTVTITAANCSYDFGLTIYEVSGLNNSSPVDTSAGFADYWASATSPLTQAYTTAGSGELAVGAATNGNYALTIGSSWTTDQTGNGGDIVIGHLLSPTSGSNNFVLTWTGSSTDLGGILAAYVPASGGASCTHSAYTSSRTFAVPTAGTTSVWLSNRTFGTTPCDGTGTTWWSSTGAWETQ